MLASTSTSVVRSTPMSVAEPIFELLIKSAIVPPFESIPEPTVVPVVEPAICERPRPRPVFYKDVLLGQTHVNGWSRVVASQNGGSTSYIFPLRLGVLQWSRHLINYWKNKKIIIEK